MSTLLDASILKTLRFNLHYFGIKGFRLPVLVGKNVMLISISARLLPMLLSGRKKSSKTVMRIFICIHEKKIMNCRDMIRIAVS